jgi:hypothetical protein
MHFLAEQTQDAKKIPENTDHFKRPVPARFAGIPCAGMRRGVHGGADLLRRLPTWDWKELLFSAVNL